MRPGSPSGVTPPWYRVPCHEYLGRVQEAFDVEAFDERVLEDVTGRGLVDEEPAIGGGS